MFKDLFENIEKAFKKLFENRILVLGFVLIPLAVLLFVRLFQLQIVRGNDYYEDYMNMTRKEVSIAAMRGNIYDRNGILLAGNRVVYSVAVSDDNYYTKTDGEFNEMLLRLIHTLDRYGMSPEKTIPVSVDEKGAYYFDGSTASVRRFIRDVYGQAAIASLQEQGKDPYEYDAEAVMKHLMTRSYNFTKKWPGYQSVSEVDALKICNIRYALSAVAFTRYLSAVVVRDISQEVQAAIMESQAQLSGVTVEESYDRVYYNSGCFSSILGYVGSITTEEIEDLNASGGDYSAGDVIGKEGIEIAYESYLQGKKGKKVIYVNNVGIVMQEEIIEEPSAGNDIYLSIDANTTTAAYNVMEQQLAGVVVNHLYPGTDYDPDVAYEKSEYLLPIRDVYFQMINNEILSMENLAEGDALSVGATMDNFMKRRKQQVIAELREYLETRSTVPLESMDEYMRAYVTYLASYAQDAGFLVASRVDTENEVYTEWKSQLISFPTYITEALKAGWCDLSALNDTERYNTVDACYDFLVGILLEELESPYGEFDKLIYDELIHTDVITGCDVGIALYEQGVLNEDEAYLERLRTGDNDTAFNFFKEKITSMEITPAQIALDPCSAGLVLTDPNTGELLAVVSYPGYDANLINDSAYYAKLLKDKSSPLYSRATQSRLAPGSTFKMITATAALEGGYFRADEEITCEGIFDKLHHPRCWIYRLQNGEHGPLDVVHALGQSCNCFFYELGYRFSLNADGLYSPTTGINVLTHYAKMYGFGELTGIETAENVSTLTTELPVTSAIGQGTNAFTTISLARYVTALASSGNVYEFKLLNHISDGDGNTILSYTPKIENYLEFSDSTWDLIHEGMYTVVHEGGSRNGDFANLRYDYAAKSGSAQENRKRPEHGLYVTYGPYDNISYAMAVQVPNGYSAGNAALIANALYEYLEGDITLEEILENSASSGNVNDILD